MKGNETKGPATGIPAGGDGHGPATGYRWEPFTEGNTVRLTHGAKHPGTVQPIADALEARLADTAPWCMAPAFHGAVKSWAYAEGQAALLRAWLDENGHLDENGTPRPAATMLSKVEGRLVKLRQELGLSPQSLANLLGKASTVARAVNDDRVLVELATEGRRIIEAQARRELEGPCVSPAGFPT